MPSVLCIAGLDPSGNSGLSADARALDSLGVRCLSVASVLTVQTSSSFDELLPVPADFIARQVDKLFDEEEPGAVKVGLLGSAEQVAAVSGMLSDRDLPIIVDPVFSSSSGFSVLDNELLINYRNELFPLASLVTPNAPESEVITELKVRDIESAEEAGVRMLDLGPGAVLVKGGHLEKGKGTDVYADRKGTTRFPGKAVPGTVRGTGCAYSSLIAGHVATGLGMRDAVTASKGILAGAIALSVEKGSKRLIYPGAVQGGGQ